MADYWILDTLQLILLAMLFEWLDGKTLYHWWVQKLWAGSLAWPNWNQNLTNVFFLACALHICLNRYIASYLFWASVKTFILCHNWNRQILFCWSRPVWNVLNGHFYTFVHQFNTRFWTKILEFCPFVADHLKHVEIVVLIQTKLTRDHMTMLQHEICHANVWTQMICHVIIANGVAIA